MGRICSRWNQTPDFDPTESESIPDHAFGAALPTLERNECAYYLRVDMRMEGAMPKKRVNMTIDAEIVERARRYTRRHDTSISQLVGEFLSQLPEDEANEAELTPTVRRLLGIAEGGPNREDYRRGLLEKYGS